MNIDNFLDKINISTLWDVISDEEIFKFLTRDIQIGIANLFSTNIKGFFETERTRTTNLVELNKKYILLILNHIKKVYPHQPTKIKIYDELPAITAEEIQTERQTKFDIELHQKQQEFENSINIKKPPVPEFTDKYDDTPIAEMDKIIKEITEQRKYDVEQINRNYNSDINATTDWLKTQGTSLKNDKLTNQPTSPIQNSRFKFLNNINPKKQITWGENKEIEEIDDEEQNIFDKLKKTNIKPEILTGTGVINKATVIDHPLSTEERISELEKQTITLNDKIDTIYNLLQQIKKKLY